MAILFKESIFFNSFLIIAPGNSIPTLVHEGISGVGEHTGEMLVPVGVFVAGEESAAHGESLLTVFPLCLVITELIGNSAEVSVTAHDMRMAVGIFGGRIDLLIERQQFLESLENLAVFVLLPQQLDMGRQFVVASNERLPLRIDRLTCRWLVSLLGRAEAIGGRGVEWKRRDKAEQGDEANYGTRSDRHPQILQGLGGYGDDREDLVAGFASATGRLMA
jgi:hypothetical protein